MATATIGVRERMAAASKRIARVKLLDRGATGVITFGGVFIILSVLFIFVFIFARDDPALPPRDRRRSSARSGSPRPRAGRLPTRCLSRSASTSTRCTSTGRPTGREDRLLPPAGRLGATSFPIPGLAGATVTAASRTSQGDGLAVGTSDGRVALLRRALQARVPGAVAARPRDRARRAGCRHGGPATATDPGAEPSGSRRARRWWRRWSGTRRSPSRT